MKRRQTTHLRCERARPAELINLRDRMDAEVRRHWDRARHGDQIHVRIVTIRNPTQATVDS